MEYIKNNLLDIRFQLKIKEQKDFADFLGIGRSNYNLIENNKKQVTLIMAFKIIRKLKERIPDLKLEDVFELVEKD